jgi:hypothetical protein
VNDCRGWGVGEKVKYADLRQRRQTIQSYPLFLTVEEVQEVAVAVFVCAW